MTKSICLVILAFTALISAEPAVPIQQAGSPNLNRKVVDPPYNPNKIKIRMDNLLAQKPDVKPDSVANPDLSKKIIDPMPPIFDASLDESRLVKPAILEPAKPAVIETDLSADEYKPVEQKIDSETNLQSIMPSFPFKFSSILENLRIPGLFKQSIDQQQQDQSFDQSADDLNIQSKGKLLSVIMIKSSSSKVGPLGLNNEEQQFEEVPPIGLPEPKSIDDQSEQPIIRSHFIVFKFLPSFFGSDSVDSDNDKQTVKLLGGKDDPDNPMFNSKQDDSDSQQPSSFLSFLNFNREPVDQEQAPILIRTDDEQSSSIISNEIRQNKKKCMMLSFMRLKASIYYRTIIHLLFISGIVLFILLLTILCLRVFKRRKALRYYSQNMNISTIDDSLPEKKDLNATNTNNRRLFLFRIGSLKNTYAQKQAESELYKTPSLLVSAPPAYEQIINKTESDDKSLANNNKTTRKSSLVNSLAAAYNNRYTRLDKDNEDTKSVSSLPAYEDTKQNQI